MKNVVLLLILSIFFSIELPAQNYWIRTPSPTTHQLTKFVFTDLQNGWAVGDSGVIIHTSNGGVSWVIQDSSSAKYFRDVFFLNQRLGWCIISNYLNDVSTIIKTINGGNSWFGVSSPDSALASVYFTDSLTGVLGEWYGKIFKTTNGGLTWSQAYVYPSQFNFQSRLCFRFYNSQYGLESGGFHDFTGLIYRTTDYGSSWIICDSALIEPINDLYCVDSNIAIGCGGDFEYGVTFMSTNNRGVVWKNVYLPFAGFGRSIAPRTLSEIWLAMGPNQKWAATFDSAKTWHAFQVTDSVSLNYCKFIDPKHGWTVGGNGAIFKYDTNMIGIENHGTIIPLAFKLYQNYPNPFNPSTIIKFEIPNIPLSRGLPADRSQAGVDAESGRGVLVVLKIYDILGREISALINEKLSPGNYEVKWYAANYSSGIYFYKLTISDPVQRTPNGETSPGLLFNQAQKMVLLK